MKCHKTRLGVAISLFLQIYFVPTVVSESEWTHELSLDLQGKVHLKWKTTTSDPGDSNWITFQLSAATRGYVAMGFAPMRRGMIGSDIYVGWVDKQGKGYVMDCFATGNVEPIKDPKQDLQLISASETKQGTTITFRRRFDTCDPHDFIIGDDTMHLIWAISDEDPIEFNGIHRLTYHGNDTSRRGGKSIFLLTKEVNRLKFPDEETIYPQHLAHFDVTVPNVKVPELETYFHCKIVKFPPKLLGKYIIAYRPIISDDNIPYIHNVNLYRCTNPPKNDDNRQFINYPQNPAYSRHPHPQNFQSRQSGQTISDLYYQSNSNSSPNNNSVFEMYLDHPGGDCYTSQAPDEWVRHCTELQITFGVGSEGIIFPEHLGHLIPHFDQYYKLEIHYENPYGNYVEDNSGLRIFYTEKLREYETGVLVTGSRRSPFLTVPPGQMEFTTFGFCSAECTRNGLESNNTKVVAVLLQSHFQGRRITLRHLRKGRELVPIVKDSNVDFFYQQYRILKHEVPILPGDELITECTYNTMYNRTFLFGGLSSRRESCQAFLIYYPRSPLSECRSQPELFQYLGALGIMNVTGDILSKLSLSLSLGSGTQHTNQNSREDIPVKEDSLVLEEGRVDKVTGDLFKDLLITSPERLRGRYVHQQMMSLQWDDDFFTKLVEQKWRVGPHYMFCNAAVRGKSIYMKNVAGFPRYLERVENMDNNMCLMDSTNEASSVGTKFTFIIICVTVFMLQNLR